MSQNQDLIKTKNVSFNESNNKKNKTPSHKKLTVKEIERVLLEKRIGMNQKK